MCTPVDSSVVSFRSQDPLISPRLLTSANYSYLSGVAITLALYDWLLTFSTEYETIYQSRWTLPKALFFYVSLAFPELPAATMSRAKFTPG
ncbi:hypothetical protein M408DRAFT_65468 [Serendipita vermifera MAFF 305830]|uniref:DUF6533 domain-containing protein n=1 Tax=Serendipita vermifera MAFF 305830 TaxID=933852 RepID=A0A0C3BF48_SERVB|nr:hypothetical protein M408DRAFT_65468 [Serendipita vermifera MAFF 305830]